MSSSPFTKKKKNYYSLYSLQPFLNLLVFHSACNLKSFFLLNVYFHFFMWNTSGTCDPVYVRLQMFFFSLRLKTTDPQQLHLRMFLLLY